MSLDGRAAGLTDARNFILAVPVSSESLPRSIKPADGERSLLKGSSAILFNARGVQRTRIWDYGAHTCEVVDVLDIAQ